MRNVVLARVDERLLHGQIVTKWMQATGANIIVMVDDALVNDRMMCTVFKGMKPIGTTVEIFTVDQAITYFQAEPGKNEKIILLVKYPQTFVKMFDAGITFDKIIFGAASKIKGRDKQIIRDMFASQEELEAIRNLIGRNVLLQYQLAIDAKPIKLDGLL